MSLQVSSATSFMDWLGSTPVSVALQTHEWMIPMIQTVHILAIAVLFGSAVAVDLKLLRPSSSGPTLPELVSRFDGWTWSALAMLLLTGSFLIVAEPHRELANYMFWTKMGLIVVTAAGTWLFQRSIKRNAAQWNMPRRTPAGVAFAVITLVFWALVMVCGRWIAYVSVE